MLGTARVRSVLLLLVLFALRVDTHLTTICAASDPGTPGVLYFHLGTYHTNSYTEGTLLVYSGGTQRGSFSFQSGGSGGSCAQNNNYPVRCRRSYLSACAVLLS